MSKIYTEAGLDPGCSRIKHLALHTQTLVKEAMLFAWIVEWMVTFAYTVCECFFPIKCVGFFFSVLLTELGILWQKGSCNLLHLAAKLHSSFELPNCVSFLFWQCILLIFPWFSLMSFPLSSFWRFYNDEVEQLMEKLQRRSSGKFQMITFLQSSHLWNLYYHSLK